jgi:hypothetical protein
MPGNQAKRKSRPRQLLCPFVPAFFSTGFLKAGAQLSAQLPAGENTAAKPDVQQSDERRSG